MLLTHTLYAPPSHNIKFLHSLAESLDETLRPVWPRTGKKQKGDTREFNLLKRAYIEARYSPQYAIPKDQLEWLMERVKQSCKKISAGQNKT